VISFIHNLTTAINKSSYQLANPRESPTPFEIGLLGIQAALQQWLTRPGRIHSRPEHYRPVDDPATNGALAGQITPGAKLRRHNFYITRSNAMDIANQVTDKLKLQGGLKYK